MSELSDWIAQRKTTLLSERDALEAKLAPIRAELAEIASVERIGAGAPRAGQASADDPSIKGLVLRVLQTAGRPLTAREINRDIYVHHGREIDRTSFSPQLSRLCRAGQIVRTGFTYQLAASPPTATQDPDRAV